jgi:hypothetical protein
VPARVKRTAERLSAVGGLLSPEHLGELLEECGVRFEHPVDADLGHKQVQRWNLPDGWIISKRPAHPALASEADFIAAQDISAARGPAARTDLAGPGKRRSLLSGLLV